MPRDDRHLDFEEDFLSKDSKEDRKERKLRVSKDRSKYKKTDQDKLESKVQPKKENLIQGRVLSIVGENIEVEANQRLYLCSLKGSLKQERTKQKNLVAVGDFVLIEERPAPHGVISHVLPRHSILSRADNLRRNKEQLIAVNIDQLFIVISPILPKLKPALVDRYIIAAKQGGIVPIVVVNKIDLLSSAPEQMDLATFNQEVAIYKEFLATYQKLDILILEVSAFTNQGIADLKALMHGKASVFSGQSGVGKSSLINILFGTSFKTADLVFATRKGSHTTTAARLVPIDTNSFCIDTPGIKSFGIWNPPQSQLQHYFSEFASFSPHCKYPNCKHLQEPDCAIKEAVENDLISEMRYESYVDLMTIPDTDWR